MIPNIDPRTLKNMMAKMGMKQSEIDAKRVIIEGDGFQIIISEPSVMRIDMQGSVSFNISGNVEERKVNEKVEINEDDIRMVMEKSGVNDYEKAKEALEKANGDIASAILELGG
ncbi:MAG: nascent polypeptide-associated complex protein [Candidatus Micrarchaeaceae archaeon]